MSLVLIAHNDQLGIICSDGRVSCVEKNGSRTIVREDSPKFIVLAENLVLSATGRGDLCDKSAKNPRARAFLSASEQAAD